MLAEKEFAHTVVNIYETMIKKYMLYTEFSMSKNEKISSNHAMILKRLCCLLCGNLD